MYLSYYFILLFPSYTAFNQFTDPVGSTFKIMQTLLPMLWTANTLVRTTIISYWSKGSSILLLSFSISILTSLQIIFNRKARLFLSKQKCPSFQNPLMTSCHTYNIESLDVAHKALLNLTMANLWPISYILPWLTLLQPHPSAWQGCPLLRPFALAVPFACEFPSRKPYLIIQHLLLSVSIPLTSYIFLHCINCYLTLFIYLMFVTSIRL